MLLDRLEFFSGQWSGFEQDPVGDSDLADVVKGSGVADQPDQAAGEAETGCEFCRAGPDALCVLGGVVVAVLRRERKFVKRLGPRAPQLARAFTDLVLERVSGPESVADVVVHGTEAGERPRVDDRREGHRKIEQRAIFVQALGVAFSDRIAACRRYY